MTSTEDIVEAGNDEYRDNHLSKMFRDGFSFSGYERDALYLNRDGESYLNVSGVSGVDSDSDGRASVFADFDNDGDTDIFLTTIQNDAHLLFRNNVGSANASIRIALRGTTSGTDAFGATVRVHTKNGTMSQVKSGGSGYLSQHDPRLLFGLGDASRADWIEVSWPSGEAQRFEGIAGGTSWLLVEGGELEKVNETRSSLPDPLTRDGALLAKLNVEVGEPFPDIMVSDSNGVESPLRETLVPGRKHLLNLWATWCIPCQTEMPELQKRYSAFEAAGVQLLGVSIDTRAVEKVPTFLDEKGIEYPNYIVSKESLSKIYASSQVFVPLTFVLDDQGVVLDAFGGWSSESQRRVQKWIGSGS